MTNKALNPTTLHTNQRLLVEALLAKGAIITSVDSEIELLKINYLGREEYLFDRYFSFHPHNEMQMTSDKFLTKQLLQTHGIQVPMGNVFVHSQKSEAIEYAQCINYPVVLKPNTGSHGDHVYAPIFTQKELAKCIDLLVNACGKFAPFLIEEYFEAKEYRIFMTSKGSYAVLCRDPASVLGNGTLTIRELVDLESENRTQQKSKKYLCPIALDSITESFLKLQGFTYSLIPRKGTKIYLRAVSNLAKGGRSIDMTDKIHPSYIEIAKNVLSIFKGIPYLGIDLLSTDISSVANNNSYKIIEINCNPSFSMHTFPAVGKPRNVALFVADLILEWMRNKSDR